MPFHGLILDVVTQKQHLCYYYVNSVQSWTKYYIKIALLFSVVLKLQLPGTLRGDCGRYVMCQCAMGSARLNYISQNSLLCLIPVGVGPQRDTV